MITKTNAQAIARARGLYGAKKAWCEGPDRARLQAAARETLSSFLDGLTLVVRCPELLHLAEVRQAAQRLLHPWALYTGPYRVGVRDFGYLIQGSGWSWDEAFEQAEAKLEKEKAS